LKIPFEKPPIQPCAEYWLRTSFHLKAETNWAKKGHEVAWEEFRIPYHVQESKLIKLKETHELKVDEDTNKVIIESPKFRVIISKKIGSLTSLIYNEKELLPKDSLSGPFLNIYKARIENDYRKIKNKWEDEYQLNKPNYKVESFSWLLLQTAYPLPLQNSLYDYPICPLKHNDEELCGVPLKYHPGMIYHLFDYRPLLLLFYLPFETFSFLPPLI